MESFVYYEQKNNGIPSTDQECIDTLERFTNWAASMCKKYFQHQNALKDRFVQRLKFLSQARGEIEGVIVPTTREAYRLKNFDYIVYILKMISSYKSIVDYDMCLLYFISRDGWDINKKLGVVVVV
jgi:hypothetical protein